MDRYPYQVPVKGGFFAFAPKHIVITSNAPIASWYHFDNYEPDAILRRVDLASNVTRTMVEQLKVSSK